VADVRGPALTGQTLYGGWSASAAISRVAMAPDTVAGSTRVASDRAEGAVVSSPKITTEKWRCWEILS
jgi:hypothetical protein